MFFNSKVKEDYKAVFDNPTGRRVLRHLMKIGFVSRPLESGDDHENTKRAGMQHLVLSIVNKVHADDAEIIDKLLEETFEDERRIRNTDGASSSGPSSGFSE